MEWLRRSARVLLHAWDIGYHSLHRLLPVGPLLFVGRTRYRGPERQFADGTLLMPGELIGTLHFNNARIANLEAASPAAIGLKFARLLFESLRALAQLSARDPRFRNLPVYLGIGWLRHGEQIGFIIEKFPGGWRRRYLTAHIRLLVWAFAPSAQTAAEARPEPVVTWLPRTSLLKRFGGERKSESHSSGNVASARSS